MAMFSVVVSTAAPRSFVRRSAQLRKAANHGSFSSSSLHCSTRRLLTSSSSASSSDEAKTTEKQHTSSLFFPWRSTNVPLARVEEAPDDLSGMPNHSRARYVRTALAARELQVPWLQALFFTSAWKQELAEDCAWAFQKAVAAVLSHTFRVPLEEVDKEEHGVILDTSKFVRHPGEWQTQDQAEQSRNFLQNTVEAQLRKLYESMDPMSMHFLFQMKPMAWRFEHAFLVPMLTRSFVQQHPVMKGYYQKIEKEFNETGDMMQVRAMGEKLAEETGHEGLRTIICDVTVECLECFQVKDSETGKVIQGSETTDPLPVTHLVRFEMVTSKDTETGRQLGSWQIIDWDDLLEGNVWH